MNATKPDPAAVQTQINEMFNAVRGTVENLACRWLDEHQYENIADYKAVIDKILPPEFTITKMTKRPFGFHFTVKDVPWIFALYCKSNAIGWKSVGGA